MGQLYRKLLDRIQEVNYDVLNNRVSLSTSEKVRIMGRTWVSSVLPILPLKRA